MEIGIFSKIGASGGSEHRCAELASGIVRFSEHQCTILCEDGIHPIIEAKLDPRVRVVKHIFKPANIADPEVLYAFDLILVINSDSYSFAKAEYWDGTLKDKKGKSKHHDFYIDLSLIPKMTFLFNFVVSPAKNLKGIAAKCPDVRVIAANKDFDSQIRYKDKFKEVRDLPRIVLESPIDPNLITSEKTKSDVIRIGKHSKPHGYKHNSECIDVINAVNDKYGDVVRWDFMGVPREYAGNIARIQNVMVRPEYSIPIREYLSGIDIFLFFISWERAEPWARVVAEAMMSGCPVLATDRAGNRDQVYSGLNGFLCGSKDDFVNKIEYLINNRDVMEMMRNNNILCSKQFTSDKIIHRFLDFVGT